MTEATQFKTKEIDHIDESEPLRRPGRLAFFCFVDIEKLVSILSGGIKPLGSTNRPMVNQFPDRVSLAAVGRGGYMNMFCSFPSEAGSIHWLVRFTTSKGMSGRLVKPGEGISIVLLLEDEWLKANIARFTGVGAIFRTERRSGICVGALNDLVINENAVNSGKIGDSTPYLEEVLFQSNAVIPPEAIADIELM